MTALRAFLFGPPRIEHNSQPIEIQRRKTLGLFIYLLVSGQSHSRDKLAVLFWPDTDQAGARANLRRDISRLKQALGEDSLLLEGNNVSWNLARETWLDIREFQKRIQAVAEHVHRDAARCAVCQQELEEAVRLYADDFMAGFSLPDSSEFDDWQFFQAEELRRALGEALQNLMTGSTGRGEFTQAIPFARRWLAMDTLNEAAHQALMRLYAWSGEPAAALRQYDECARLLREKLKILPDEETTRLHEAIKLKQLEPPPSLQPEPSQGLLAPAMGFPNTFYSFIGREKELAQVVELLRQPDVRLVTIIGLGGIGKTRLSLEAARLLMEESPMLARDGGAFFSLASVDDPDGLPYCIAKELRINLSSQVDPMVGLAYALENKRMLLLMDNFEQLVKGASMLEELLNRCPGVKMLVTSREPLHLSFEWRVDLDGLPYPPTDAQEADEYEAVRLFMQTAGQVRPGFPLNEATRPLIYRLCASLAGIPLAIRLAASWLRVMTIEQIVAEVERGLDILTGQMRDIPDRQRSMNAVFESTWGMLSSEEQRAFASLSVFRGGFNAAAAQQVADISPYLLAGLVDRGMVRFLSDLRYEVHELTRQFGAGKLKENQSIREAVRGRHSAYYLDILLKTSPALFRADPGDTLQNLRHNFSNIQEAWDWAVQHLSIVDLQKYILPLSDFYELAGFLATGEKAFQSAIQCHGDKASGQPESDALFTLWMHYLLFLIFEGQTSEALAHLPRLDELAKASDNPSNRADALQIRGMTYHYLGRRAETIDLFERAVAIYRPLNTPRRLVYALNMLGEELSFVLRSEEALACHQETLEISRRTGELRMEALSLSHLGNAHYYLDHFDEAVKNWTSAVECFERCGDKRGEGRTRNNLAYLLDRLGQYKAAARYGEESLSLLAEVGDRLSEANSYDTLGEIYFHLGQYDKSRRCFEKAIQTNREMKSAAGDMASLHANLAMLDIAMGRYAEAQAQLDLGAAQPEAERHPREMARSLKAAALLCGQTGQQAEALEKIDQALLLLAHASDQLFTNELLVWKASLLVTSGRTDEAESVLHPLLGSGEPGRLSPSHYEAGLLAARIAFTRGDKAGAERRLEGLHTGHLSDAQHAELHYTHWLLDGDEESRRFANEHYQRLARKTPDVLYQKRLDELKKALSAPI